MITPKQALNNVKAKNPGQIIAFGINYSDSHYVFGLRNKNLFDTSGDTEPYFAVDKKTGEVSNFIPDDYAKFFSALQSRPLSQAMLE